MAVSVVFLKCVGNCYTTAFIHKTSLKSLYNMLVFNCKSCLKEAKSLLFMISKSNCEHYDIIWTTVHKTQYLCFLHASLPRAEIGLWMRVREFPVRAPQTCERLKHHIFLST